MPYTIALPAPVGDRLVTALALELVAATEASRFVVAIDRVGASGRVYGAGLVLRTVRLREPKPYCGQHPGECLVARKKPNARWLEWDDWVEFNGLVNDVLDRLGIAADVWSNPREVLDRGSRMWARRRDLGRRFRYDWEEEHRGYGTVRVWNHGSDDQFEPAIG